MSAKKIITAPPKAPHIYIRGIEYTSVQGAREIINERALGVREYSIWHTRVLLRTLPKDVIEMVGGAAYYQVSAIWELALSPQRGRGDSFFSEQDREKVMSLAATPGTPISKIVKITKVSGYQVSKWLNELPQDEQDRLKKANPQLKRPDPETKKQALALNEEGISYREIATRLGVSLSTVYTWVQAGKKAGPVRRTMSPEAIQKARQLHREGKTLKEISDELGGITPSAIWGHLPSEDKKKRNTYTVEHRALARSLSDQGKNLNEIVEHFRNNLGLNVVPSTISIWLKK